MPESFSDRLPERDIEFRYMRGSGAGGQHRNKTESCVVARHVPTGTEARVCSERSQHQNKAIAIEILTSRIAMLQETSSKEKRDSSRRAQIGSGMRGDKVRTVRVQDSTVKCEITGLKKPLAPYLAGNIIFPV